MIPPAGRLRVRCRAELRAAAATRSSAARSPLNLAVPDPEGPGYTHPHTRAGRINEDGSAGAWRVHASGVALDDFAFDVKGNLYGTTDPFNTVVRVRPDGTSEVLLTAADGLDGPTATAFGVGRDSKALYITNAAFPFFLGPDPRRPSLMRLEVGIPGKPRP